MVDNAPEKTHQDSNKQYGVFIGILFFCLLFFLTSNWWVGTFLERTATHSSDMGTEQTISATSKLTLKSWVYDEKSSTMEIRFDSVAIDTIERGYEATVEVMLSDSSTEEIKASFVGCYEHNLFIVIPKIPEHFRQVAVTIGGKDVTSAAKFYADKTVAAGTVTRQTETDFRVYAIDLTLQSIQVAVNETEQNISSMQYQYRQLDSEIMALEADKKYQTQSEQIDTTAQQTAKQNEQQQLLNNIDTATAALKEYEEKVLVLKDKKAAILAGSY